MPDGEGVPAQEPAPGEPGDGPGREDRTGPETPADTPFRRLHPLTPLARGWGLLAGGIAALATNVRDVEEWLTPGRAGVILGVLLVVAFAYGYLSWRFTRYRIAEGELRLDTGVVFRRTRHVRIDRLQAVDVVRPLVARLLGLAALRMEVAGGGSEAPLAYLSEDDAMALRAELLARAAGVLGLAAPLESAAAVGGPPSAAAPPTGTVAAPAGASAVGSAAGPAVGVSAAGASGVGVGPALQAPEGRLVEVPTRELVISLLLNLGTWGAVVGAAAVAVPLVVIGDSPFAIVLTLVPAISWVWAASFGAFSRHFGFTLSESPDGLRIRHGLLENRHQTVPPGRVQAVEISQPVLWRRRDWVRVRVNVAGYAGAEAAEQTSILLPVAPRALALHVIRRVVPGLDLDAVVWHPVPRRARWLRPWWWRGLHHGVTEDVFLTRYGLLNRTTALIPHAKVQSMAWSQGPLQRRLGLASVRLHSTDGPVGVVADHRDAGTARRMVLEQAERSRIGRRQDGPERWMTAPGGGAG
ncbi:PH domain-containing protein [Allostreptomyces psammosilenae]|uniref:Putative membrane protein n=1 Tax=Allostreptomyces psammosilenae TaxID=1892865 RepID=A0A852ZVP2_9ACTN|nr:PH domain-containing protein [Allostreptomyces psammosilenae]NYI05717.1 putative membrane protein [Allostreptomyces psammosilenae]